jgi:hypothetical protein
MFLVGLDVVGNNGTNFAEAVIADLERKVGLHHHGHVLDNVRLATL